ncbi:hypothetical protein EB796_021914 [Bugula neritina]|uniref:Uncharacterized protein n=1 Tax=Bugula neritina TaxID=10212 RepID=A0A7J7J261_BUGNE|nr:hypothetical protein EB796_021914 [Bugula neritina]
MTSNFDLSIDVLIDGTQLQHRLFSTLTCPCMPVALLLQLNPLLLLLNPLPLLLLKPLFLLQLMPPPHHVPNQLMPISNVISTFLPECKRCLYCLFH